MVLSDGVSRKIDGKKYLLTIQEATKSAALQTAKSLRSVGYSARVVRNHSQDPLMFRPWLVFRRAGKAARR